MGELSCINMFSSKYGAIWCCKLILGSYHSIISSIPGCTVKALIPFFPMKYFRVHLRLLQRKYCKMAGKQLRNRSLFHIDRKCAVDDLFENEATLSFLPSNAQSQSCKGGIIRSSTDRSQLPVLTIFFGKKCCSELFMSYVIFADALLESLVNNLRQWFSNARFGKKISYKEKKTIKHKFFCSIVIFQQSVWAKLKS